jgi:Zn finger protein HypA/HybF involved in hydrogenase expression
MNRLVISRRFVASAVFLLAALATVLALGSVAAIRLTLPREPVSGLGMDRVFWGITVSSGIVVLVCLKSRSLQVQLALILWFGLNLVLWRAGWAWLEVRDPVGYFTELARAFQLAPGLFFALVAGVVSYLVLVSGSLIAWNQLASRREIKLTCEKCGGHVIFSRNSLGQQLPCPHCGHALKLRQPGNLKMSCYFCQGHIEFPSHALGTKMSCPHCQRDITLVEPK